MPAATAAPLSPHEHDPTFGDALVIGSPHPKLRLHAVALRLKEKGPHVDPEP